MSQQQRTPHVTGLNNAFQDQWPEPGSFYKVQGGTTPISLAGPVSGFTVALGFYSEINRGDLGTVVNFEPVIPGSPPPTEERGGGQEYLVGTDGLTADGWGVTMDSATDILFNMGGTSVQSTASLGRPDLIVMASYVPDGTIFGIPGNRVGICVNGQFIEDGSFGTYTPVHEFQIGGIDNATAAFNAPGGDFVGMRTAQLNSFWITEGVPTLEEALEFMDVSMQAGQVVPQPWAVARTVAAPDPVTPDEPTGHHWSVNDLDLSTGIGGTWTDRIGGIILERIGTLNDSARELGRQPSYYPWDL